ncbi:hypothetical protein [Dysgonomonas sp. ZJ709]|uniref:hypothetical protein n=1 Tax=Dysgonomonas sp. ZJ709 TaxID=2709797 RepID=UPI0013EC2283|nr:hypothetical protein [Dysgonomonas sp. ZJ709]
MKTLNINSPAVIPEDRIAIARLLKNAVNNLCEADDSIFMKAIKQIVEYHENSEGEFPILTISRDDICQKGFNPHNLSDDQMRNFANEMSTEDLMESFWFALEYVAENDLQLPELRTEIDMLYEDYKKEFCLEPNYATIWLEDKEGNNLPGKEIVKLNLEVVEKEDEQIYMNFDGFNDFKNWLFSILEQDSESEDTWSYDYPEHRIQFFDTL